jgi:exopolysaccharide biosynthesis polyprenyl glycosylphosphotransferase
MVGLGAPGRSGRARSAQAVRERVPTGTTERAKPARRVPLRGVLIAADLVAIALGWSVGAAMASSEALRGDLPVTLLLELLLVLPVGVLLLSANGLYRRRLCQIRAVEISRIGRSSLMLCGLLLLVLVPSLAAAPAAVALAVALAGATWFSLLTFQRGLLREWILRCRAAGDFGAAVYVLGGDATSTVRVAQFLSVNPVLGLQVRGLLCPASPEIAASGFRWVGPVEDLARALGEEQVSGAVLDASSLNGQLNPAVSILGGANLHAHIYSGLRGIERRRILVSPMADETFLHVGPLGLRSYQRVTKRALDLAVASMLLLVTGPFLLLCAAAIRLTDGGPALYRQERVGQGGERFQLLKLRTMHPDADLLRAGLEGGNVRDGPLFKLDRDPRVTRLGSFLRRASIDELPQLLNVLEGTMSMVGPRPALPEEVAQFDEELVVRLSVKPGLTGLWQVEARDLPSFDLYRRFDLMYVQNWSLGVDITVMLRTVMVVLAGAARSTVPRRVRKADAGSLE